MLQTAAALLVAAVGLHLSSIAVAQQVSEPDPSLLIYFVANYETFESYKSGDGESSAREVRSTYAIKLDVGPQQSARNAVIFDDAFDPRLHSAQSVKVEFKVRLAETSNPRATQVAKGIALEQGGVVHYYHGGVTTGETWEHYENSDVLSLFPNVDWSMEGEEIRFGFYNSVTAGEDGFSITGAYDNLKVTIKKDSGTLNIESKDALGQESTTKVRLLREGEPIDLFTVEGAMSQNLPPGNYVVEYPNPTVCPFDDKQRKKKIEIISGLSETVRVGGDGLGRLSWVVTAKPPPDAPRGFTTDSFPEHENATFHFDIYQEQPGAGVCRWTGRRSSVDLPPGEYRAVFQLRNGLELEEPKFSIEANEELPLELHAPRWTLTWTVADYEGTPVDVTLVRVKDVDGNEFLRQGDYLDLDRGEYTVQYEIDNGFVLPRKVSAGAHDVVNMSRVVIVDKTDPPTSFGLRISSGGEVLKGRYRHEHLDLGPGTFQLTITTDHGHVLHDETYESYPTRGSPEPYRIFVGGEAGRIKLLSEDEDPYIQIKVSGEERTYKTGDSGETVKVLPGEYDVLFPRVERKGIRVPSGELVLVTDREGKGAVSFETLDDSGEVVEVTVGIHSGERFIKKINSSETALLDPGTYSFSFIYPGAREIVKEGIVLSAEEETVVKVAYAQDQGGQQCYRRDGIVNKGSANESRYPHTMCLDFDQEPCGMILNGDASIRFEVHECSPRGWRARGQRPDGYSWNEEVVLEADTIVACSWADSSGQNGTCEGERIGGPGTPAP